LLAAREAQGASHNGNSVILLYLHGGPSQLETYDLKPEAPTTHRSIFQPIRTNVPGLDICELFPLQAKIAHRFSLVRSLNHDVPIHSDGGIVVLTGKRPTVLDPTSKSKSEHPDLGSVVSRIRGPGRSGIPAYVSIPQRTYMTRPTYLGLEHGGFDAQDPSEPGYRPAMLSLATGKDQTRLENRRRLLADVDRFRRENDPTGKYEDTDRYRALAFELLTSAEVAAAFDLAREPDPLRDRYGRNLWGQGCLLARRLVEAGSSVISVFIDTPKRGQEFTNWDDHIMNAGRPGHFGEYMKVRLPYLDQCLSSLINDLFDRGLDEKVMVVVVGEFGRTPRLSVNANGTGRDHWPQAYTALVSGGGLRMGQVIGATNESAEYPTDRPYGPEDLLATVYRHLGISTEQTFVDTTGRPVPILYGGQPIPELIRG
ncbi:MAG: DUF1501 domain-containing protein, partial [Armatimonadetes bacterium]|nr:DUF1501 domain-containing protein [Armatimonadota bacterium]